MNEGKRARVKQARKEAENRRQKALVSLAHCLSRSNMMRIHHDTFIREMLAAGGVENLTDVKQERFTAYVCFWFASLAAVIERYEQLVASGTLPESQKLTSLLSDDFIDLLKPFRNAVAHCPDHDDTRVLAFLNESHTMPDRAAQIAHAFREYFEEHMHSDAPAA